MTKKFYLFSLTAAAALLAITPVAQAKFDLINPSIVTPGDTFSYDILAYNTASGSGYFVAAGTATFGLTSTVTGTDGNIVTITSSETVGVTTTTDTFTISTPANFYAETTLNGLTITGFEFDLGNANSGSNTISLLTPIANVSTAAAPTTTTATGSALYSTNTRATLTPGTTLSNNNTAYEGVEGLQAGTSAINQFTVRSFTYSLTYANAVPEPSTYAFIGAGALALGLVTVRRNRKQTV